MRHTTEIMTLVLVALGAAVAGAGPPFAYPTQMSFTAGEVRSCLLTLNAPPGKVTTEMNLTYPVAAASRPKTGAASPSPAVGDWPSYNKTLTSERYSELSQINTENVGKLKVLCTYDKTFACAASLHLKSQSHKPAPS